MFVAFAEIVYKLPSSSNPTWRLLSVFFDTFSYS